MNSVDILGYLKESVDEHHRFFEYTSPFLQEETLCQHQVVVRYWNNQPNSRLIILPSNTRVLIHGHLDGHDKFGTILLVEQLEVIK